ncbi:MAG: lipoyl(octanoyl) transferase, partial [Bacteroidota bacterium]|nr:lipoyl(octanoyl) transferase [Bacteroidota bacterium]
YFNHINPCGFTDKGTTSLEKEMGMKQNIEKVKNIVRKKLGEVFDLNWTNINS